MKKVLIICLALVFTASLAGPGLGQEKPKKEEAAPAVKPAAEKAAEPSKEPQAKMEGKKEPPKPVTWRAGGVVDAVDAKAGVITIRQATIHHDWTLKLKVSARAAKGLSDLKPGDLVNVWITDQVVTSLTKLG